MRKLLLMVLTGLIFLPKASFGFDVRWDDNNAKVGYILQRDYQPTLLKLVHQAKSSIVICQYFIDYTKRGDDALVVNLVDDLINARKRGVKIKVILENTVLMNNRAYSNLMKNGIECFWDHDSQITHSKLIVIDNKRVVIGSTNWTERAFRMNNEAAVLIESEKLAQTALAELSKLKLMESVDQETKKDVVYVPAQFILDERFGPKMAAVSADKAFNLYLIFLKMSQEEPDKPAKEKIILDYQTLSKDFEDLDKRGLKDYRRIVQRELDNLENKYHLIRQEKKFGEKPEITLLDLAESSGTIKIKKQESIAIPKAYWNNGYARNLTLPAKFMYLIGLKEGPQSQIRPWWSLSQEELINKYHVKRWTLYTGTRELKMQNIMEVENSQTDEEAGDLTKRMPNKYKINELLSDTEKKQAFDALAQKYGETNFQEAKKMAGDLDEPNDPIVIETFLQLVDIYGLEKVQKAVAIPAAYKPDNSMKSIAYVIGILQKNTEEKEQK